VQVRVFIKRGLRKQYIEMMADFLVGHLKLKNSRFDLAITPVPTISKNGGWVIHEGKNIVMFLNPKQSPYELAHTLAHEFVHVKQVASGLLRYEEPLVMWRGKKFGRYNRLPYLKRPWEVQALQQQAILVRLFEMYCTTPKKRVKISRHRRLR